MEPSEIKAACVEAVRRGLPDMGSSRFADTHMCEDAVNAVLDTILAHTGSPYTVDELTRIRG